MKLLPYVPVSPTLGANTAGYPLYPANEDVYSKYHKDMNLHLDETQGGQTSDDMADIGMSTAESTAHDSFETGLDIPGAELYFAPPSFVHGTKRRWAKLYRKAEKVMHMT